MKEESLFSKLFCCFLFFFQNITSVSYKRDLASFFTLAGSLLVYDLIGGGNTAAC